VIDAVGGSTLAAAIAQTAYRGAIASTGVASGGELLSTVYPFILLYSLLPALHSLPLHL
jgi:acrylyl-CoA reductase (NADPH)